MSSDRPGTPNSALGMSDPIRGDNEETSPLSHSRPSFDSETFQSPAEGGIDDISVNLFGGEDDFETKFARLPSPDNGEETDNDAGFSESPRLVANLKTTGLDDEMSRFIPFSTSPTNAPAAGSQTNTGLDDESASVNSKGSELLDKTVSVYMKCQSRYQPSTYRYAPNTNI